MHKIMNLCRSPFDDGFIGSGRKNWTNESVKICLKMIGNGAGVVPGELFDNKD